ncbi:hypothetical protein [Proteiniborus sp. MB09-C3]|uniref:hypothetical protein n=1 Tax=Proteiniborus sp. MB09-C3 TaxID=3050072 RepID=UPI0025544DA4|nr:hypothetical protein [Proteiniborus sp. MB09-C3]WIV12137.1 hypothetical protein QO263_18885 [Proteiniborus sp. MB09-C3]
MRLLLLSQLMVFSLMQKQATIILPMILCIGSQVQFIGRVLAVADVPSNKYLINCAIGIICAVIAGLFYEDYSF